MAAESSLDAGSRRTGYPRGHIGERGGSMDDHAQGTLSDEDIKTILPVGGVATTLETDPDRTSEVEVRFVAETPLRTRVELEHRNLDRHGPNWEAVGEGVGGDEGWPLYLARFAALFTQGS